jgi:superfamily II DNA or RNA helicase
MDLASELRSEILKEYEEAKSLSFPMFPIKVNGKVIENPNLMQRMVVLSLLKKRTLGNWSDMGTGKTLAAVLGSYVINAKFTIICCPNSVKEEWESHIKGVFPNANICYSIRHVTITNSETFLIVNYEQFQQGWSKKEVDNIIEKYKIDLLVFDEIHLTKQRDEKLSNRRGVLMYLRTEVEKKNNKLYVIGQTGTPCINETMREPISQLELISGKEHEDLPTKVSIPNIFRVRQPLILNGIRCPSNFEQRFAPKIEEIDCSNRMDDLFSSKNSLIGLDQILMEEKVQSIISNLNHNDKTIVYVHYVKKIVTKLQLAIEKAGYRVDTYTGNDTEYTRSKVKKDFIHGDTEVLIASKPVSVGVDGLQRVCHKMIIAILPWTGAEYRQLVCRLERTGQENNVEIIIPISFIELDENYWSIYKTRWNRIIYKQTIGDMLTDGVVPDNSQLSVSRVKSACLKWFDRVASGKIYNRHRNNIVVEFEGEGIRRNNNFSDLTQMHIRLNKMHSSKTAIKFDDIDYFTKYHELCESANEDWEVMPREVIANWCKKDEIEVIGDFGCGGKCHIAKLLPDKNVYSYDHNSINDENVVCCDIADVPLEDEQLDVAIFSLSLMGSNYKDYLLEAHRCLKQDGKLYIAELTNHKLVRTLIQDLMDIGFKVSEHRRQWKFTFIKAVKV